MPPVQVYLSRSKDGKSKKEKRDVLEIEEDLEGDADPFQNTEISTTEAVGPDAHLPDEISGRPHVFSQDRHWAIVQLDKRNLVLFEYDSRTHRGICRSSYRPRGYFPSLTTLFARLWELVKRKRVIQKDLETALREHLSISSADRKWFSELTKDVDAVLRPQVSKVRRQTTLPKKVTKRKR